MTGDESGAVLLQGLGGPADELRRRRDHVRTPVWGDEDRLRLGVTGAHEGTSQARQRLFPRSANAIPGRPEQRRTQPGGRRRRRSGVVAGDFEPCGHPRLLLVPPRAHPTDAGGAQVLEGVQQRLRAEVERVIVGERDAVDAQVRKGLLPPRAEPEVKGAPRRRRAAL